MPASTTTSMVLNHFTKNQANDNGEDLERLTNECKELLLSLPREKGWRTACLYKYKGFWCQPKEIQAIISFQKHFQPRDTDVILASIPKSGTTWLKALSFAILNRKKFAISSNDHPLLVSNPHDLAPFFEYKLYADKQVPDLSKLPDPRLFATHIPFASLQDSIKKSNCRIIYICRNPFDTFISSWTFSNKLRSETVPPLLLEETFKMFCEGVVGFGPFWDHMLGYVLEGKLGETRQEEKEGVVEKIASLCSFEKMKNLEVNKSGRSIKNFENKHLFRKAEVGDWVNYLSPSMVKQLSQLTEEKLGGSGIEFKVFP
ncbi:hypothetical protein H0E87_006028 [Populus deltoides]|uniref:Sulfotransferase n=1 Tax=Populus deltoides TaxID=3696 RepID=A0A8T2Z5F5_POPDE|nr:hypothetical protein H0E87_006028 [Populus deltoides]